MASRTVWWKDGDVEAVQPNKTRTKTHELCPECGAAYGIHGKLDGELVHPGDTVVNLGKGNYRVEHPDPMAQAIADL